MDKFKFGELVFIDAVYEKRHGDEFRRNFTTWEKNEWLKKEGVYLGKRVLKEGETFYEEGEMPYFKPSKYIPCALIGFKNRNPLYVPIENIFKS